MVLADGEDLQTNLVGKLDFLDKIAKSLSRSDRTPGDRVRRGLSESVDADCISLAVISLDFRRGRGRAHREVRESADKTYEKHYPGHCRCLKQSRYPRSESYGISPEC